MRVAIVDYRVEPMNPSGGCHWRLLRALSAEHEFTVFSVVFDNPDPARIRWVRIPAPPRPLALLFIAFHLMAPWYFRHFCRRQGIRFDKVQMIESNFSFADISYVHFCHSHYLHRVGLAWSGSKLRSLFRWLDHRLHAWGERSIYARVPYFVVPSAGLRTEVEREYPFTIGRIGIIHNPIDLKRFELPCTFEREDFRRALNIGPGDCSLVFVALGHFERKGLPALLQAISEVDAGRLKLVVVGGTRGALAGYRELATRLGVAAQINFVGSHRDIRPYLWAADAFILPSSYETFSLVTYEAAAAGLPLIVNPTSGIEDILSDGENGTMIGTSTSEIVAGLRTFLRLSAEERQRMGSAARRAVQSYSADSFVNSWRAVYDEGGLNLRTKLNSHVNITQ